MAGDLTEVLLKGGEFSSPSPAGEEAVASSRRWSSRVSLLSLLRVSRRSMKKPGPQIGEKRKDNKDREDVNMKLKEKVRGTDTLQDGVPRDVNPSQHPTFNKSFVNPSSGSNGVAMDEQPSPLIGWKCLEGSQETVLQKSGPVVAMRPKEEIKAPRKKPRRKITVKWEELAAIEPSEAYSHALTRAIVGGTEGISEGGRSPPRKSHSKGSLASLMLGDALRQPFRWELVQETTFSGHESSHSSYHSPSMTSSMASGQTSESSTPTSSSSPSESSPFPLHPPGTRNRWSFTSVEDGGGVLDENKLLRNGEAPKGLRFRLREPLGRLPSFSILSKPGAAYDLGEGDVGGIPPLTFWRQVGLCFWSFFVASAVVATAVFIGGMASRSRGDFRYGAHVSIAWAGTAFAVAVVSSCLGALWQLALAMEARAASLVRQLEGGGRAGGERDAKAQFLGSLSHEVRTPLNGMIGMLGSLQDSEGLPEEQQTRVEKALVESWSLTDWLAEFVLTELGLPRASASRRASLARPRRGRLSIEAPPRSVRLPNAAELGAHPTVAAQRSEQKEAARGVPGRVGDRTGEGGVDRREGEGGEGGRGRGRRGGGGGGGGEEGGEGEGRGGRGRGRGSEGEGGGEGGGGERGRGGRQLPSANWKEAGERTECSVEEGGIAAAKGGGSKEAAQGKKSAESGHGLDLEKEENGRSVDRAANRRISKRATNEECDRANLGDREVKDRCSDVHDGIANSVEPEEVDLVGGILSSMRSRREKFNEGGDCCIKLAHCRCKESVEPLENSKSRNTENKQQSTREARESLLPSSPQILPLSQKKEELNSLLQPSSISNLKTESKAVNGEMSPAEGRLQRAVPKEPPPEKEVLPEGNSLDFLKGKRVLVVDDNVVNRKVIAAKLKPFGCVVSEAVNGREAVEKLTPIDSHGFVCVFMDLQMPVMDGYDATREIRRLEALAGRPCPRVAVVAVTADVVSGARERCEAAGMDGFLTKPLANGRLRAALGLLEARLTD